MTPPTEIEALEGYIEDADYYRQNYSREELDRFDAGINAAIKYLQLLKGEHETLVIVPRKPTNKILDRMWTTPIGKKGRGTYEAMIQASQEGK